MMKPLSCSIVLGIAYLAQLVVLHANDTWPFNPKTDSFSDKALLDLRDLNEKKAGTGGWIKMSKSGGFVRGDGKQIRFWAVNTGVERGPYRGRPQWRSLPKPNMDYHARWLAKRGVNMVRCHSHINPDPGRSKLHDVNMAECEWIWQTVGTMSKYGIYTTASPYWANTMKSNDGRWGTDWQGRHHGLLFFDKKLQDAYKAWLRKLFTTKSNHLGGRTLAESPGLALFQIQNEDSMLFWTVNNVKGPAAQRLGKQFVDWAIKKYGSVDKAYAKWGRDYSNNDKPGSGVLAMINVWNLTRDGRAKNKVTPRHYDQLQFWTEMMYDFNKEIQRFVNKDLKCPVLVNAGNWKTADNILLEDAERYSYTANEVIAVNRYFSGIHQGKHRGWAIINGDQYSNNTALGENALAFPLNLKQVANRPMLITESTWVFPEENAFESPLMIAAYSALTGFDAYYWFATGDNGWTPPKSANGYLPSQSKWICMTPDMAGQWPGAAYLFRKGLVKKGDPVVEEHRSLEAIYNGKTPIIAESASFDPNRDAGDLPANSAVKTGVSPWAFLAGPVTVTYKSSESKTKVADLKSLISKSGNGMRVKSITGQLTLDTGKKLLTVNAPKCQAISGHFGSQSTVKLKDVSITTSNRKVTVMVIAMQGKRIKSSKRILVQVGSPCRPTGWATSPTTIRPKNGAPVNGYRITSFGKAPWQVDRAKVTITLNNNKISKGTILDMNGMARGQANVQKKNGNVVLTFPEDAMYVILQ